MKDYRKSIYDKKAVGWDEVEVGQHVYIPGDLKDGKPTCTYGYHLVANVEKRQLVNGKGRVFYERSDKLYLTMHFGELNRQGNWMIHEFWLNKDTGYYHTWLGKDWWKYITVQDADYFGIWINYTTWTIITYAEGDETVVCCPSNRQFMKELISMDKFYGEMR